MKMKQVRTFTLILGWLLIATFSVYAQKDNKAIENKDVLLKVAGEEFTAGEFMYVYNKNNRQGAVLDKKSISEYLDLYIDFRLKVKEAESLGMDTASSFVTELSGYRAELAKAKLRDSEVDDKLMREAYDRSLYALRASHIMIAVAEDVDDTDEIAIAARKKLNAIRDSINNGASFRKMAIRHSDDPSARPNKATNRRPASPGNGGDLGYFTAFYMVYPFESAVYNLELGDISEPVRTQFGYHIIMLTDKIDEMGKIRVAHINVKPQNANSKEDSINTKNKAFEIWNLINKGEMSFEDAAKQYSDDRGSATKGGLLPWFEINRMIPDFIKAISRIDTLGDISAPVYTMYGWHIIKLVDIKKLPAYEDYKDELKKRIARDSRSHKSQEIAIANFKKEFGFKDKPKNLERFHACVDSSLFTRAWKAEKAQELKKGFLFFNNYVTLFKLDGKKYTIYDFAEYLETAQRTYASGTKRFFINSSYKKWVNETVLAYKDSKLEEQDLEFKMLVREYHDGILLFSISQQEVWDKAIMDSTGLKAFHEANKNNYMWKERQDVILYNCKTDSMAFAVQDMIKAGASPQEIRAKINSNSQLNLTYYQAKFEKGQNKYVDKMWGQAGTSRVFGERNMSLVVQCVELLPAQPKQLDEARGLITADYQNHLNENWMKTLKEKYSVEIDDKVLKELVEEYGEEK